MHQPWSGVWGALNLEQGLKVALIMSSLYTIVLAAHVPLSVTESCCTLQGKTFACLLEAQSSMSIGTKSHIA